MKTVPYVAYDAQLSSNTRLGLVHLKVSNLENQIKFYTIALKLTVHEQSESHAILGDTQKPLLYLQKVERLKRYHSTTGMYHFALLYPNEKELAKAVAWLYAIRYENAPTDHGMSKTTYLKDLEGNDIELYVRTLDRADYVEVNGNLAMRYKDGRLTDGRDPLDLDELFANLSEDEDIQTPLTNMEMGHIHLYGTNVDDMTNFYTNVIGFAPGIIEQKFKMGDVGLDYKQNHIIAFNAWKGTNIAAPQDALGLDYFTIQLTESDYQAVIERLDTNHIEMKEFENGILFKDPSHINVKIEVIH